MGWVTDTWLHAFANTHRTIIKLWNYLWWWWHIFCGYIKNHWIIQLKWMNCWYVKFISVKWLPEKTLKQKQKQKQKKDTCREVMIPSNHRLRGWDKQTFTGSALIALWSKPHGSSSTAIFQNSNFLCPGISWYQQVSFLIMPSIGMAQPPALPAPLCQCPGILELAQQFSMTQYIYQLEQQWSWTFSSYFTGKKFETKKRDMIYPESLRWWEIEARAKAMFSLRHLDTFLLGQKYGACITRSIL